MKPQPTTLKTVIEDLKFNSNNTCTYCHRLFGSTVSYKRKSYFLERNTDHVIPKAIGGKLTVPCCSLCNHIKGSLVFDSIADIQDYILDKLLKDYLITNQKIKESYTKPTRTSCRVHKIFPKYFHKQCRSPISKGQLCYKHKILQPIIDKGLNK